MSVVVAVTAATPAVRRRLALGRRTAPSGPPAPAWPPVRTRTRASSRNAAIAALSARVAVRPPAPGPAHLRRRRAAEELDEACQLRTAERRGRARWAT